MSETLSLNLAPQFSTHLFFFYLFFFPFPFLPSLPRRPFSFSSGLSSRVRPRHEPVFSGSQGIPSHRVTAGLPFSSGLVCCVMG